MDWKGIIIHCTASKFGGRELLKKWHVDQNGWDDIGYHFGVLNGYVKPGLHLPSLDGSVETYRSTVIPGAHAIGYNDTHIGVVLVGNDVFSPAQKQSLRRLLYDLCMMYDIPYDQIIGHNQVSSKTCPNFDVPSFVETLEQF